jgi:hypothetical protein
MSSNRFTPQNDISKEKRKQSLEHAKEIQEDFLDFDNPLPGQNYVCMSFVSPESAIEQRYMWFIHRFLEDLVTTIPQPDNMPESEYKTKLHKILMSKFTSKTITNLFDDFMFSNFKELDKEYNDKTDFRTSVRALKIRGVYDSYKEAKRRSDQIARFDKAHNVYIGQVGYWLPWDPDANEISEQEYQNKELNALMKSYKENVSRKDEFFRERKEEKLKEALDKNKTAKRVSGEEKETLDKVRRTIVEKNEILQKVKDSESKTESKEEPSQTTFQSLNTSKEEISSLFDTPDPWMQTKVNKKE